MSFYMTDMLAHSLSLSVLSPQKMADRFQSEISTAMRSKNNATIHHQLQLSRRVYDFLLKECPVFGFSQIS